jgi:hypothetical protein
MKKLLYIFVISLCFISISVSAKRQPDSLVCLEITGKVLPSGVDEKTPCKIELLSGLIVVDSLNLKNGKGKFSFFLLKDRHYTIRLSRKGHISRSICVNTQIPDKYMENLYGFSFDIRLIESKDAEVINQVNQHQHNPVARIFFQPRKQCFYYSRVTPGNSRGLCSAQ